MRQKKRGGGSTPMLIINIDIFKLRSGYPVSLEN